MPHAGNVRQCRYSRSGFGGPIRADLGLQMLQEYAAATMAAIMLSRTAQKTMWRG